MKSSFEIEFALDDISNAAQLFLKQLGEQKKVAFYGQMGAGKTTFITELCAELKALDIVSSPTFAIVNEYETEIGDPIFHFDFYRIKEPDELFDIGFEEYLDKDGWCFIEWPERAENVISDEFMKVEIVPVDQNTRIIRLK